MLKFTYRQNILQEWAHHLLSFHSVTDLVSCCNLALKNSDSSSFILDLKACLKTSFVGYLYLDPNNLCNFAYNCRTYRVVIGSNSRHNNHHILHNDSAKTNHTVCNEPIVKDNGDPVYFAAYLFN
jgi:hypothetical protein